MVCRPTDRSTPLLRSELPHRTGNAGACFHYTNGQCSGSSNGDRFGACSGNRSESDSNRSYYSGVAINCNCHQTPAANRYCASAANCNRHRDTDCGANGTR